MMQGHRYTLEKGSKKYHCPECSKKTFVRYIDTVSNEYLEEQYGRCDREVNCAYHHNPYLDQYYKNTNLKDKYSPGYRSVTLTKPKPKQLSFIPESVLRQTLKTEGYKQNVFLQNLVNNIAFPFEAKTIERLISLYYLGTVCKGYRSGAITFPFIDNKGKVRAIQVKQFDRTNHTTGIDFLHSIIEKYNIKANQPLPDWLKQYLTNDIKVSCLFGEHLLSKYPLNPVALVEAPKTAIYGTLYFGFPDNPSNLIWLAVYNLSSLNLEKCKALQNRDVYLFPDLSKDGKAFALWSNKASDLIQRMPGTSFKVSDLLERNASESDRLKGQDLADFLIKQDWRKFSKEPDTIKPIAVKEQDSIMQSVVSVESVEPETNFFLPVIQPQKNVEKTSISNDKDLNLNICEHELFFKQNVLPDNPIKINDYTTIIDVAKFVESHLSTLKANKGRTFLPYLDRLQELKNKIEHSLII